MEETAQAKVSPKKPGKLKTVKDGKNNRLLFSVMGKVYLMMPMRRPIGRLFFKHVIDFVLISHKY
jgi:hypothetical protein